MILALVISWPPIFAQETTSNKITIGIYSPKCPDLGAMVTTVLNRLQDWQFVFVDGSAAICRYRSRGKLAAGSDHECDQ
jgi:hypothetical protein